MKVIYIVGLGHSGSTLLNLILGRHKQAVGLGEVANVLNEKKVSTENPKKLCSCGLSLNKCPFWKKYSRGRLSLSEDTYVDRYRKVLSISNELGYSALVDSSKKLGGLVELIELHKTKEIELVPIFLLKDVRSWTVSMLNVEKRKTGYRRSVVHHMFHWYNKNRKIKGELDKLSFPYLQVSYEELCFNTENVLDIVWEFTGLFSKDFDWDNFDNSHIAFGNRMKKDVKRRNRVTYDYRWFNYYNVCIISCLFPWICSWNKLNVYLNKT